MRLPIASKAIAPMLWLLASESKDGIFDGSLDELVFRLHITEKEYQSGVKPLIDNNFFTVVSGVLADRKQVAIPETETETEGETEKERDTPEGVSNEVWDSFVKQRKSRKAQITERVMKSIREQAKTAGWSLEDALNEVVIRNWQTFRADWVVVKQNPADIARLTVPASNEPDPALEKIKSDDKKAVPPSLEVLAKMAQLRAKA